MIIKIENSIAVGSPLVEDNFRYLFPSIVFPLVFTNAIVEPLGYAMYDFSQIPECGVYQKVVETAPAKNEYGIWRQQWQVVDLTGQELIDKQQAEAVKFQKGLVNSVQKRLDDFAKTRNYDGVLSACTYATSPTAKFATEGQYCVAQRDATWSTMYQIMAEVEAGTRPMPTSYADIEPDLPARVWPV